MSREVEVTGIKLTATTPQTIEISLGKATTGNTLTAGQEATAPGTDETLWSHTAATGSVYKDFGKLIPASSVNGSDMLQRMVRKFLMLIILSTRQLLLLAGNLRMMANLLKKVMLSQLLIRTAQDIILTFRFGLEQQALVM